MIENAQTLGFIGEADSLDYLNQRISELQNAAASTADGIGSAVDTIRNELDLLLGDLSPYNDRQKLEMARAGLQAGTVSQEQFLTIARRLFASSSQYAREFDFAMQYPGSSAASTGGESSYSATTNTDTRSLAELIAARDELLAQQQAETARTLAQQLAEMSAATGESYAAIAEAQRWNLAQLGETLGLDQDALAGYLDQMQAVYAAQLSAVDYMAGTYSIVGAINDLPFGIASAMMGNYDPAAWAGEETPYTDKFTPQIQPINVVPVMAEPGSNSNDALLAKLDALQAEVVALREEVSRGADAGEAGADAAAQTAVNTRATTAELIRLGQPRPGASRSSRTEVV